MNPSFIVGVVYYYGFDQQPYTCLFENKDIVLFEYPYQGYKRHCLKQIKEIDLTEWSAEAKPLHKKTLTSLFTDLVNKTEAEGDFNHRTAEGSHLTSTIEEYGHLSGQGTIGDFDE